jgi:hypothetical protein
MQIFYFTLSVSYDLCEKLYEPDHNSVVMTEDGGKRVQIPIKNLRPFVSPQGLKGRFKLVIDAKQKLKSFQRVA